MSDNKQKSTLLKDAIILFVITIIAAFALGAVYEITKDPIAEAEAKAKTEAAQAVFAEMKETADAPSGTVESAQALIDQNNNNKEFDTITVDEVLQALDENGNKIQETSESYIQLYKAAYTFDISQTDGKPIPSEAIRLTGGLFSPAGADLPDLIAAFDARFAELAGVIASLSARVKNLEDDTGILP